MGDEGGDMCELREVRAAEAVFTTDGLRGTEESTETFDVGLVRSDGSWLTGSMLEAEVQAGGITLVLLVFLRLSLPP